MYNGETLSNGARVIALDMPGMESVTVGFWIGVGGRFETERQSGISHFLEHLLFKGTKKRSSLELTQIIEGAGGSLNAFTSQEYTCYFAKVLKNKVSTAVDILADMYFNAEIKEEDVEKERKIILEELHMGVDSPPQHAGDLLDSLLWSGHPLGRRLIGTEESLNALRTEDISSFRNQYYLPSQTVIAITGNLKHCNYKDLLEEFFNKESGKKEHSVTLFKESQKTPLFMAHKKKTEQTHIALGVRTYPRGDKNRFALKVLNTVLGGNMSSRLFQNVREKHGYSYDIHSSTESFCETGALFVSAGMDNKRIKEALSCVLNELVQLKKKCISSEELKNAKEYTIGRLLLMNEKTTSQMIYSGEQLLYMNKVMPISEIIRHIDSVSAQDVNRVAREIFTNKRLALAMIGPVTHGSEIEQLLDVGE